MIGAATHGVSEPNDVTERIVDLDHYPLYDPNAAAYRGAVADARASLQREGCAVVAGFLRPSAMSHLQAEAASVLERAHVNDIVSNPYSTRPDPMLGPDHPINAMMERTNAFVPTESIPHEHLVRRLYHCTAFKRFVADCLDRPQIHEYADPFAALVLNLLRPGAQHPWHYDTNEFIVSTLIQPADDGGIFEYCPGIRRPGAENYDRVGRVIRDEDRSVVRQLRLVPGDLQLFMGRFSLHRVTRAAGHTPRITAIFAYAETPGLIGKAERTRQLFGRVAPEHLAAADRARTDGLTD